MIVRDGRACDFLGGGRTAERLVPQPAAAMPTGPARAGISTWWVVAGAAVALLAVAGYVVRRAR